MLKNSATKYGWPHVVVHWLVAVMVFVLFTLGLWMSNLSYTDPWYHKAPLVHQSVGVLLVALMVFRLVWRHIAGMPKPLDSHSPAEKAIAKIVHIALYALVISMFFTGYVIVTSEGQDFHFFGVNIPAIHNDWGAFANLAANVHEIIAFAIVGIAGLHGLAALKHHFLDKDLTFKRMLGL